jgi:hypothetical protein
MPRNENGGAAREVTSVEITPELVRQVADKVYRLWQQDAKIAAERRRLVTRPRRSRGG